MGNFYPNLYDPAQAAVFVKGTNGGQIASNSPGLGTSPLKELQGSQLYLNGIGLEDGWVAQAKAMTAEAE